MEKQGIIEALIFSADGSLPVKEILGIFPDLDEATLENIVADLNRSYETTGRSFRIEAVSGGYMFVTREEYSPYIIQVRGTTRLSNAALEVLALVAYKGPCTKQTIEAVRGVDSTSSLKNLLRHQLIDIKPGKPMRYFTTDRFLEMFGLDSLNDLPDIRQFEEVFGE